MAGSHCRGSSNSPLVAAAAGEQRGAKEEADAVTAGDAEVLVEEAGRATVVAVDGGATGSSAYTPRMACIRMLDS